MRELILKELKLENFQKFKNETFEFGAVETHIYGENRAGKTTVQSAMLWLLFGKDANGFTDTGRGAFDIKRRDKDGEVVHADVTVEGTFLLDGEKVVLKRVLHENYTKKGDYTGDETQCFVNCTPYQMGEYKKYIEGIISEEEFRMITNIEYFLSLKTDFQRKYLCTMGGVQSVEDICKDDQQWKAFLDTLSGKTIEDALKQIAYERKELKKQYEKIPVSIQSLEKVKPEPMDWEGLETEKEGLNALIDDINESISDENKAMEATANEIAGLMKQSSEKRKEFYQLTKDLQEAKQKAREEAYRELEQKNKSRRSTISQMDAAKRSLDDKRCELQVLTKSVEELNKDMQVCFEEYQKLQESTFQYDEKQNICPLLHNHVCDSPALLAYLEKNREKAEADFHVSKEKKIQEKLIKFATRVPVFMYLTDYRERSLKDVITQLEPGLFKKVTGLDVKDFELLCSLGVFNANLMNDAIFKFKRYEDSSLSYTGIDKHSGMDIGGWDTVIKREEYEQMFYKQQATMEAPTFFEVPAVDDIPVKKRMQPVQPKTQTYTPVPKPNVSTTPVRSVTSQYVPKSTTPTVQSADSVPAWKTFVTPELKPGMKVYHQGFGEGTIVGFDKTQKFVRVKFEKGEKMFICTSGNRDNAFFNGFLTLK